MLGSSLCVKSFRFLSSSSRRLPLPRYAEGSTSQTVGLRVILGVDATGGQRYVQLADRAMPVFPTADVTCDGSRQTIPLTRSDSVGDKIVATYAVPPKISEAMLKAVECRLLIPGQELALSRQQILAAWPSLPKSVEAVKETTSPPPIAQAVAQRSGERPGVPPESSWTCPIPQPIKGNFTTYSGERCIYHMMGGQFYGKTKPERCYATELEARSDECRRSRR
jgi:hypothetical protein